MWPWGVFGQFLVFSGMHCIVADYLSDDILTFPEF